MLAVNRLTGKPSATAPVDLIEIDTDKPPLVPDGYLVHSHTGRGVLRVSRDKFDRMLKAQSGKGSYYFDRENWLDATVLDHVLERPELLPDDVQLIWFFGTLYTKNPAETNMSYPFYVRCLSRDGKEWKEDIVWGDPDYGPIGC